MPTSASTQKPFGAQEIVTLALHHWKLLLAGALLGAGLGVLATRWIRPDYQASLMIQVNTQAKRPAGGLGDMADLFQTDSKSETEIVVMQSTSVLGPVVDSFHLRNRWASTGFVRRLLDKEGRLDIVSLRLPAPRLEDPNAPWTLVAQDTGSSFVLRNPRKEGVLEGKVGVAASTTVGTDSVSILVRSMKAEPGETFKVWSVSRADAVNQLKANLKVVEIGRRTDMVSLKYVDRSPKSSRDILDDIASSYIEQNIAVRSSEARKSLAFLQGQIPEVRHQIDSLEGILNSYRFQKGTIDIGTEARVYLDDQSRLQQQILALDQQRQELLRLYREDHPSVAALDARRRQLQSALSGSSRQVKSLPLTQQQVMKLQRDLDVNTSIYTNLLNNVQQLQIVQGGEVGNSRIVDWADLPDKSSGPSSKVILVIAMLAGLLLAFAGVVIHYLTSDGVSDPVDLEPTGIPVLAQIPTSVSERSSARRKGTRPVLASSAPNDLSVEALRSLRTALNLTLSPTGQNILSVGGLIPGVGKTFVCANLATLFAQQGKKVILIDADLRRGRLHGTFGQPNQAGLAEVLRGERNLADTLQKTDIPNLLFLGKGQKTESSSELLESPLLSEVLTSLSTRCDLILVDTSPLLLVSDAIPVLKQSKHTLLVLQSGTHSVATINQGIRKLLQFKIESVSIAMNQCRLEDSPYKGYGAYVKN